MFVFIRRSIARCIFIDRDKLLLAVQTTSDCIRFIGFFRYTENAKIASEQFRDRPVSPAESIVHWTEHVIRHGGASHLKPNALNLKWYQILLLDVTAVILATGFIVSYTIYKMSRYLV